MYGLVELDIEPLEERRGDPANIQLQPRPVPELYQLHAQMEASRRFVALNHFFRREGFQDTVNATLRYFQRSGDLGQAEIGTFSEKTEDANRF